MPCVWITRSEPGATRLEHALRVAGYETIKVPVLKTVAIDRESPRGDFDLTIFVSEHAVDAAMRDGWRPGVTVAIGRATANALDARGIEARVPELASSEGVRALIEDEYPTVTSVLLVSGEGGRRDLDSWLAAAGIEVTRWTVYRRVGVASGVDRTAIDAIVVGSIDGLRRMAEIWFAAPAPGARETPLIAPSARVAEAAREVGFACVATSADASPVATVEALAGTFGRGSRKEKDGRRN